MSIGFAADEDEGSTDDAHRRARERVRRLILLLASVELDARQHDGRRRHSDDEHEEP